MKRFWTILLAGLVLVTVAAPAFAWEFQLKGQYEYRYRWWSRTGQADLFGNAALQEVPINGVTNFVGLAGPSFWGSGQLTGNNLAPGVSPPQTVAITRGGFSTTGSDAQYPDQVLTLHPTIRLNPAVRIHGTYNVGGIRHRFNQRAAGAGIPPYEKYMPISALSFSSEDTVGVGSWEQVRATVQSPIGIFSIGMKDFPFGVGLFTTKRLRGSAFVLVVPYGPIRFIPAFWQGYSTANGVESYNFRPDGTNKANWFGGFLATYDCGPMTFAGGWIGRSHHRNAYESNPTGLVWGNDPFDAVAANRGPISLGTDEVLNIWALHFKYFNGRFGLGAAYEWATNDVRYLTPLVYNSFNGTRQQPANFGEYYHLLLEAHALAGPAKVSLMWAQSSGAVRNMNSAGTELANVTGTNPKNYVNWGLDAQCLDSYQYLMFSTYAGGNQTFTGLFLADDGKGLMSDAFAFGARADYAVASNLNVYASYLWAHRLEKYGTYMGQYANTGALASFAQRQAFLVNAGINDGRDHYVEDGFLGYEWGAGFEWKLLEGFNLRGKYAYWQPGEWFNYAYQALTVNNGVPVTNGYMQGRDAIQALEGSFVISF